PRVLIVVRVGAVTAEPAKPNAIAQAIAAIPRFMMLPHRRRCAFAQNIGESAATASDGEPPDDFQLQTKASGVSDAAEAQIYGGSLIAAPPPRRAAVADEARVGCAIAPGPARRCEAGGERRVAAIGVVAIVQTKRTLPVVAPGPAAEKRCGGECSGNRQNPRHLIRPSCCGARAPSP